MLLAVLAVTSLALPGAVLADSGEVCTEPIRTLGPVSIKKSDLVRPKARKVQRSTWTLDSSWTSVRPRLSQYVKVRAEGKIYTIHAVTWPNQKTLSIDAYAPEDYNWLYVDDDNPDTAPCQMVGQSAWQPAKIYVREGKTSIAVAAASQHTVGDATGCVLGPDNGVRECPILTRSLIKLKSKVGARTIYFDRF